MQLLDTLAHIFHPRRSNNHRPRLLHPEALFYVVMVTAGFFGLLKLVALMPGPMAGILGYASNISPEQVVSQTNQQRVAQGLPPLNYNAQLSNAALFKGQHMLSNQYWAHNAPDGTQPWSFIRTSGYSYSVAGENLARDFNDTGSMVAAWMASPTHRDNIVNSRYQDVGIAVIDGVLQGTETTLVVQMFGTSSSGQAQATEPSSPVVQVAQAEETVPTTDNSTAEKSANDNIEQPTVLDSTNEAEAEAESDAGAAPTEEPSTGVRGDSPPTSLTFNSKGLVASMLVPMGVVERPPLFTPLQLTKAFFLAVIVLVVTTLLYDTFVIGHRRTARIVGKNLAHILLLLAVGYLIIFFKGGVVG